jgi:DNA-binding MarR family transcriptional regulator
MLLHFSGQGSLPVGKIGERLQVHRTSITNSLDGLEKAHLVRRVPHRSDRRAVLAEITAAGRESAEAATAVLNASSFGTEPLATGQLDDLFATLRTLRAGAGDFAA